MKFESTEHADRPPRFIRKLARKTPAQIAKLIAKSDIVGDSGISHHPFCFWVALETNTTHGWFWWGNILQVHHDLAEYHPQYWKLPDSVIEFGDRFHDGEYPELVLTDEQRHDGVLALLVERVHVNGGAEPANLTCHKCGVAVELVRHRVNPDRPGLPLCEDCGRNRPTWSEENHIHSEFMRRFREYRGHEQRAFGRYPSRVEPPTRAQVAQDLGIENW